jgi:hypothetical protein
MLCQVPTSESRIKLQSNLQYKFLWDGKVDVEKTGTNLRRDTLYSKDFSPLPIDWSLD